MQSALRKHLQKLGRKGGKRRAEKLTPAERQAIARKGGLAAKKNRQKSLDG